MSSQMSSMFASDMNVLHPKLVDCRDYTFPSSSLAQAIPVTLQMDEVDHNLVTDLFADFFQVPITLSIFSFASLAYPP